MVDSPVEFYGYPDMPMSTQSYRRVLLLALLLGLGFALRFSQPTLVEFKRDEATVARLGQAIAYEGWLPAVGVDSSLGIDNLPLTLYLVALPLRLWSDPLAAVFFTILLNCMALPVGYQVARAALGERAAWVSTALFAVSPWAVLYARKIWARTLPLFVLLFIGALLSTFVWRKRWALVGAFAGLAALLGLQLEALAFVPLLAAAILVYRDAVSWRPLLVGLAVFALLLAPYVVYDALNGWDNARGLLAYAMGGGGTFSWDAVRYSFELVGSGGIEGQAGPYHVQFRQQVPDLWWMNGVLGVMLAGGLVYGVHQAVRGRTEVRRRTFVLLLGWYAFPVLLQLKPSAPTQPHYFVMHYPVLFMLIGSLLAATTEWVDRQRRRRPWMRWAVLGVGGMLAIGCGWQVLVTARLRATMVEHPSTGGYGIPLRYTRQAAQAARRNVGQGEVIVLGETTHPFVTETPTVFDALLFGVPHRFADLCAAVPFPQREQVIYLSGPLDGGGEGGLQACVARLEAMESVTAETTVRLADGVSYRTSRWDGTKRSDVIAGLTPLGPGVPFANAVVFAAYSAGTSAKAGESYGVTLAWWVREGALVEDDFHFTVQVLSAEGGLIAQDDHAGFPSSSWKAGDLVLASFDIPLNSGMEPGVYRVRAGMYTYPDVKAVAVVDVEGQAVDDGVVLTQLRVMRNSERD